MSISCLRLSEETTSSFVESIVAAPRMPSIVVHRITFSFVQYAIAPTNGPSSEISFARRLLSNIQQRHPAVFQQVTEDLVSTEPSTKDGVEQLIISLSLVSRTLNICVIDADHIHLRLPLQRLPGPGIPTQYSLLPVQMRKFAGLQLPIW